MLGSSQLPPHPPEGHRGLHPLGVGGGGAAGEGFDGWCLARRGRFRRHELLLLHLQCPLHELQLGAWLQGPRRRLLPALLVGFFVSASRVSQATGIFVRILMGDHCVDANRGISVGLLMRDLCVDANGGSLFDANGGGSLCGC